MVLGALLALGSAATFGFNSAALRRGVLTGSVLHAMAITVPIGVPLFALACVLFGAVDALKQFGWTSWIWLGMAGVVHFVIGRYGNYKATHALGAALSAPIQQLSVPIAVVLALLLLDERLTPLRLLGFALVMLGPVVSIDRRSKRTEKSGFKPHYRSGLFWGGVSAICYGCSPLMVVVGLGPERSLTNSLAGGFASYLIATIALSVPILFAGGAGFLRQLDRPAGRWFLLSGVFVFVSQLLRYMSLAVAPVSVVVPIQRLSVIFRIVFAWIMNRDHEVLGARVITGIIVSFIGVLALTLSTDFVAELLPARWQWIAINFE